jgi:hypothetical protein
MGNFLAISRGTVFESMLGGGCRRRGRGAHGPHQTRRDRAGRSHPDGHQAPPDAVLRELLRPNGGSCALGAAYEGVYLLPTDAHDAMPRRLDRFFDCLENTSRRCPAGCKKQIPIGAMIVHLNDDHEWTREMVAAWLRGDPIPQAEKQA